VKIAIIGSRGFQYPNLIADRLINLKMEYNLNELEIISGGAKAGADAFAKDFTERMGLKFKEIPPDMSAGYDVVQYHIRNDKIIQEADKVIAFWDGKSRGTKSVIEKCLERGKNVEVIFQ
jgi:hypothetical protein